MVQANPYETASFLSSPDRVIRPGGLAVTSRMVERAGFSSGDSLLDLGCGLGTTVAFLRSQWGLEACGLDVSDVLLQQGRTEHPGLPLVEGNATELPFDACRFDGVIAECSLSAIGQSAAVAREVWRVLRPGGKFLVADVYPRGHGCALLSVLESCGFSITSWEDRSDLLRNFAAALMMRQEADSSPGCFWGPSTPDKPGYFLMEARKDDVPGGGVADE